MKGGYCKMTQIDTRGEGGGSKMDQKFNTYFLNGPLLPYQLGWSQKPKILWSTGQKHKGQCPENNKVDPVLIGEGY